MIATIAKNWFAHQLQRLHRRTFIETPLWFGVFFFAIENDLLDGQR